MRRLLAVVLVLFIGFPMIAPVFALEQTGANRLPLCCRRNGAHHCQMTLEEAQALAQGNHFVAQHGRCPSYPAAVVGSAHHDLATADGAGLLSAGIYSQAADERQAEAWARVALAGARHKRGPPVVWVG